MKVAISHELVMPRRMVFGEVIGHVEFAFAPEELEVFLIDSISEPVKTHVEGFGELLT